MTPADLASALLGKPITSTRIAKCLRHLTSREGYQAFLEALPEDLRAMVRGQLDAGVEKKFA